MSKVSLKSQQKKPTYIEIYRYFKAKSAEIKSSFFHFFLKIWKFNNFFLIEMS